ncbi:aldolase catalytic domain-containing protein [Thiomicrorhabdus sp. 6S3-12]|nr:aldolase catalytic domain-containing protein [Thiomicrorhabdus sp. 6S3-12]
MKLLDCTLRDGGYYNSWDFDTKLVQDYLLAMDALNVDFVEIGFRSLNNNGFKGGCAYSTDAFLNSLAIPSGLVNKVGVMVNGSELVSAQESSLAKLFSSKDKSPVSLVRIACHVHEFETCLPAASWLKNQGYLVGFNLMQVAEQTLEEITQLANKANEFPIDALYFADSMGSLNPNQISEITNAFKKGWAGDLGIHTHDNMGQAISNSIRAVEAGVTWVDSTVTGMGRGSGNAQTEYLSMALEPYRKDKGNPTKLFELIRKYFKPMQANYGWGTNPYYYMAGRFGIHPTYIQEMLQDSRYSDEDILAVIEHLKIEGGKKFSLNTLESARHFYYGEPRGKWKPADIMQDRDVLIIGTGPGVGKYQQAIEEFIKRYKPYVIALNTQKNICEDLIDARAACHPVRLLADCQEHLKLPQPLITPASMLPIDVKQAFQNKKLLDFGIALNEKGFEFHAYDAELPSSLVIAYVLAVVTSGRAERVFLAGFDGYPAGDSRNNEIAQTFRQYQWHTESKKLISLTPTSYEQLTQQSVYGMI